MSLEPPIADPGGPFSRGWRFTGGAGAENQHIPRGARLCDRAAGKRAPLSRRRSMPQPGYEKALIVGAGSGLSASLARLFAGEGMRVSLAARNSQKLAPLCAETGAKGFTCNAVDPEQVA